MALSMEAPSIQFVTTSDAYNIAYCVSGDGTPLVFVPPPFSHLQSVWLEDQRFRPWLDGLSAKFQLIVFDPRGMGMSSRGLGPDHSLEDWQRDLEAVVDRLSLKRFILLGASSSSHVAIHYAVEHPERVHALVLLTSSLDLTAWPAALFRVLPNQNWELFLSTLVGRGLTGEESQRAVGRLADAMTQADWEIAGRTIYAWSVRDVLSSLQSPALILQPRDYVTVRPEEAMKLAAQIRGARMVLIKGDSMLGDAGEGIAALESFLAGLPAGAASPPAKPLNADSAGPGGLSSREVEVLRLICQGKSNQEIADELVISANTVIRHVSNIFAKAGVANRAQAAIYARDHGLA